MALFFLLLLALLIPQLTYSKFEYGGALNPKFTAGPFELTVEAVDTF